MVHERHPNHQRNGDLVTFNHNYDDGNISLCVGKVSSALILHQGCNMSNGFTRLSIRYFLLKNPSTRP